MIHMWAFLDPLDEKIPIIVKAYEDSVPAERVFRMVKASAKLQGCNVILFDGRLYRYDPGSGKFIGTRWDILDWK